MTNREYGFCNLLGNCLVYSKNLKDYNDMRKGLKSEGRKEFAEKVDELLYEHSRGDIDDTELYRLFSSLKMEQGFNEEVYHINEGKSESETKNPELKYALAVITYQKKTIEKLKAEIEELKNKKKFTLGRKRKDNKND